MRIARPSSLGMLRRINSANLPSSAVVLTDVLTAGDGGTSSDAWAPVGDPIACRLSIVSGKAEEIAIAEQLRSVPDFVVVFPVGSPISTAKRLVVSGETNGVPWTKTLEVVGVAAPKSVEAMRKVYCTSLVEAVPI